MIDKKGILVVKKKDGRITTYLCSLFLDEKTIHASKKYDRVCIVTFHTKKNMTFLKKQWGSFLSLGRHTQLIFINPKSTPAYWSMYPVTHSMFSKGPALIRSIDSLQKNVEVLSEQNIKQMVTNG